MTDFGDVSHYLEIHVNHVAGEQITLCQSTYLKKVLDRFKMIECKPASIPMDLGVANSLLFYNRNVDKRTIKWYESAIKALMWPAVYTCPDIAYSVGVFSRYCNNLRPTYCNLVIQIFRYLSKTFDLGITFNANPENNLVDYTDFDYTGLINGRKSTGGYIIILSGGLLSYQLKLQSTVALSLYQAKYMATTKAGKKALQIAQFLVYLGFCLLNQHVDYMPIIKEPFH